MVVEAMSDRPYIGMEIPWEDLRVGQLVRCQYTVGEIAGKIVTVNKDPEDLYLRAGDGIFPIYTLHKAQRILLEWAPKPEEPQGLGAVVESLEYPFRQWIRIGLDNGAVWIPTSGDLTACSWADLPDNLITRTEGWIPDRGETSEPGDEP